MIIIFLMISFLSLISFNSYKVNGFVNRFNYGRRFAKILHLSASTSTESSSSFYVTTPIYYVNGEPHLGHAYTSVAADVLARFEKKRGKDVYFLTGTDEHGQKVQQSAENAELSPQIFSDNVSEKFRNLIDLLGCSNDDFIRTSEDRHKDSVVALWKRLESKGYIYLGAYEGWYSVRDESFYTEGELVDGKAPTGADVEWVKEESYFFKLSAFTEPLLNYYKEHPNFIGPDGRRNEVLAFVSQEGGLRDLSISRTTFDWGVKVPDAPEHVVYVWLDALTNYISALGWPDNNDLMDKYWPADVHIVGKDILRFHAVFWPAFMMAADLPLPKRIFAHGWWTKDGEKMSKSVGNVLDPFELVDKYGLDFVRYFMMAEVPFGNDGDFSDEAFALRINSNLANELGNLVQRVLTLVNKNCDKAIPEPESGLLQEDNELLMLSKTSLDEVENFMNQQQMHRAIDSIMGVARACNKYIDVQAPWALKKTDIPRMKTVLYVLAEVIRRMAIMLEPFIPTSCEKILDLMNLDDSMRTFASIRDDERIIPGTIIEKPTPIFPRIDLETIKQ